MLNGISLELDREKETLLSFRQSPHEFHLTGSRFFGMAASESDYDFFVQDTPGIMKDLRDMGFQEIPIRETDNYTDVQCRSVFRKLVTTYGPSDQFGKTVQFDIQIVRDAQVKSVAQRILFGECPELVSGQKNSNIRKRLWGLAYCMANTIILARKQITPAI
jgi:hypothetical protein